MGAAVLTPEVLALAGQSLVARRNRDPWAKTRRANQTPPDGDWTTWLVMAGRGFGKTRTGAEWVREQVMKLGPIRVALVAPTAADARDVMVQGESGLLACCERYGLRATYKSSLRRVDFPNGATAFLYSADEPDRLRGPQHHCFVAGTMIQTPDGERPIEALRVGDMVLTRFGARQVLEVRSKLDTVGTVDFSNGAYLRGNSQHPVLSLHGWTMMSELQQGDTVCTGSQRQTDTSRHIGTVGRFTNTAGYGKKQTAQSPLVTRFITAMVIAPTTPSTIWNWSLDQITKACTTISAPSMSARAQIAEPQLCAAVFSGVMPSANRVNTSELINDDRRSAYANAAGNHSQAVAETSVVNVVSTWVPDGQEVVYNLTVETDHEYIANGIVVHNCAWSDEAAAWRYPDTWDMLQFGLRLGAHPQSIVTTTPKPVHLVRQLLKQSQDEVGDVALTHGSTFDNAANLAPSFLNAIKARYEGTRLGRQEISGELLTDVEGALWNYAGIDGTRVSAVPEGVDLVRILVAVDPPASSGVESAECGIVVSGLGSDGDYYVLDDRSLRATPNEWARHAFAAFDASAADSIVIEVNQGGEMATNTLRTVRQDAPIISVRASRGKFARAEPVSALYEQGRVHHVGSFPTLEDQLCTWIPDGKHASPDRLDALVWGLTELSGGVSGSLLVGW